MGHVDDSHHTEGDRKSSRSEHQDKPHTQPEEGGLHERIKTPLLIDRFNRLDRCLTKLAIGFDG